MTLHQSETNLIESYISVNKQIRDFKFFKNVSLSKFSAEDILKLKDLQIQRETLAIELTLLNNTPITQRKVIVLINQLEAIIEKLKLNNLGYNIASDQALIFEGAIFFYVVQDIEDALEDMYGAWHIPNYFYSPDSNFDHESLKNILENYKNDLVLNRPENFIQLEKQTIFYIDKITSLANANFETNRV